MVSIRQAIVVEGRYDVNKLKQLVDAQIIQTHGFGVMKDRALLEFLRKVADKRGLIILTDPDGAGFVIRNFLKGALPPDKVRHAYVPDRYGKEKRKAAPGKEGKLGVEGMPPEVILKALEQAGASFSAQPTGPSITKYDLYELGYTGKPNSAEKRAELLKKLQFPEHMSTNALLDALNCLYTREEFVNTVTYND